MESWIMTPIAEILKCFVPPIKRQTGYLVQHEKKIGELRTKVNTLSELRSELQQKVDTAEKNLQKKNHEVQGWIEEVDKKVTQDNTLEALVNGQADLDQTMKKKIKRFTRRYCVGKFISEKKVIIDELILKGSNLSCIPSGSGSVHGVDFLPKDQDPFETFPSRAFVTTEVMTALKDNEINLIGVYGMGGIGKTMLITQICKQVKDKNLFKEVIIVTVSQKVELKKIQGRIADVLEFKGINESEDETTRASILSDRLMKEKSILIVLDDLWTDDFNLHHVGIPYGENKGCKVVITSRIRREFCGCHEFLKNIEVKTIQENEPWDLFKKKVGDIPDSDLAKKIVKECNGLPIALVVLGCTLRNKDIYFWKSTALQLKKSDIEVIPGMNPKVFRSIKLSYDFLGDIEKRCFLLCCLFPEDHRITVINDLMMYFICDTDLHGFTSLEEVRGRLHTILQTLTDSSLLLRDEFKSVVWMHDIIRDVAISIAKVGHGFFAQAGMEGLTKWPSSNARFARLSVMRSSICGLPDQPQLPHLVSMSLEGNETLKNIPDAYFQGLTKMETLDLRSTGISKLPKSISLLVCLRTLYLDNCVFDPSTDISLVGLLKKLVILSLHGCNLERLPQEIGELTDLKLLNLSHNKSLQVPPNVISRLSQLEELYMKESFTGWEIEGWQSEMKAGLEEITSLLEKGALTTLHFSLDKSRRELVSEEGGPSRIRLDVTFGQRTGLDYSLCHNFLDLMVSPPICQIIMVLLERVQTLKLKKSNDLKSVAQIVPTRAGFKGMKSLGIEECNGMESLMTAEEAVVARNTFSALEGLVIRSMNNLEQLFDGSVPIGFIDKLERLTISKCNMMVSILDSNLLARVPNLDELKIAGCGKVREIFNLEESSERTPEEDSDDISTVLKVTKIYLQDLPSLEFICKGVISNGGFDNLLLVDLYCCNIIEHLFSPDIAAGLRQLEKLRVRFCLKMVKLIGPVESMVECSISPQSRFFPKLKSLIIERCYSFEQLWVAKSHADSDRNPVLLPELLKLELKDLPELTDLHQGSTSLEYPCLEHLEVVICENLKRICLSHQRTPMLKEIVGNDEAWFQSIEWENPSDKQQMHDLFKSYGESNNEEE